MIRMSLAALSALTLLAGCGGAPQGNAVDGSAANMAVGNDAMGNESEGRDFQAEVDKLDEGRRNGVFIRALRDAGLDCQGVTASQPAKERGPGAWRVRCNDGRSHLIQVQRDGTATILSVS